MVSLLMLFFSMYILLAGLVQWAHLGTSAQLVLQTIVFHWFGLLYMAGHARTLSTSWRILYGLAGNVVRRIQQVIKYYFGMLAIVLVGAIGWGALLQAFGVKVDPQDVVTMIMSAEPLALKGYMIFLAVVLAPVFEEFCFRGILFPVLMKQMPVKAAAVVVSLIFSALHAHLPAFVPLLLVSLCLCRAYWRTGSLWVSIGMHMLFNGVNLAVMFCVARG